jgi:hypothetical protein
MHVKSGIKAGGIDHQHNQTLVREVKGIRIRSGVKAGVREPQHNQTIMRDDM